MPTEEVTDKDVDKARKKVDDLRDKVAQAEADLAGNEANRNNVVRKASLDAEAERLEKRLAAAREAIKASKAADDNLLANIDAAAGNAEVDTTPSPDVEPTPTPAPGDNK